MGIRKNNKKSGNRNNTTRQVLFALDRYTCVYCGKQPSDWLIEKRRDYKQVIEYKFVVIPLDENREPFEIDHLVPSKKGGKKELTNLVTACRSCNLKKSGELWEPRFLDRRYKYAKHIDIADKNHEVS